MKGFLPVLIISGLFLAISLPVAAQDDEETGTSKKVETVVKYRLDTRYMDENPGGSELNIMAAEAEVNASIGDKIDAALQIPLGSSMTGRGRGMHFGNAYAVFKGEIGKPTLKVGQFVVPFGNLPDYETHTRILQTLYPYSLGIRIDPGIEVEGFLNENTEYQVALTNGNGPYEKDIDSNKVVMGRLSRKMQLGEDDLKIGLSALKGRLPVFSVMTDPLMDGKAAKLVNVGTGMLVEQDDPTGFADKKRYAVDFEWYRGIDLIRGEFVTGSDDGENANGQWIQYEHPLNYKTSLVGQLARWKQFSGDWKGWAVGAEHKLTDNRIMRLAFEQRRASETTMDMEMDMEMNMKMTMNMFTLQYLVEF